ncbi:MAG TPA: type II secretion system F family protein [Dermatophilaceae bacterium]|nr:type II secretion system F family protein [Dermatophilaceae bacterium]
MSSWSLVGAVIGLVFGLGCTLVVIGMPHSRRPGLTERLAPYLRDALPASRLLAATETAPGGLAALTRPLLRDLGRWVDRLLGGSASVRRRLQRAGLPVDLDGFRAEQVVWGAVGGLVGLALGVLAMLTRGASVGPVVILVLVSVALGVMSRDTWLSRQAQQREQRMLVEFPTVAELLALAVSAGESAVGALDRVCRLSRGELAVELGRCLADARAGANLPTALQGLADRTGLVSLSRFVDGMVIAVERGTPLAEVLRAQAQDVREAGRRQLMETGGRKEIAMMVPVVFLVLPVTVLFAIFPGITMLKLGV